MGRLVFQAAMEEEDRKREMRKRNNLWLVKVLAAPLLYWAEHSLTSASLSSVVG